MKTYEFGDKNKPVILLLPGTCCHWKANFGVVIPMLERSFYVVCVSYDGFDEMEDTVFPSMTEETERIEEYIHERFDKIHADGTVIHCFYATKMGEQYEARYQQHFADPDVIRHDMQHEELLACYPQRWVSEIEKCCGILTDD